ncbi:nucleotidyltransferase domain-containing protein [bacterium]|nr:nucleotidyltransferase domain-containing protein [bacterium]
MTNDKKINQAVRLLAAAAAPRRIILFGSHARGDARPDSDLDFVVLEDEVKDRRAEMVRLLRVLEPHEIPADIFVASEEFYEDWKDVPGTMLFEAAREGKIVYETR